MNDGEWVLPFLETTRQYSASCHQCNISIADSSNAPREVGQERDEGFVGMAGSGIWRIVMCTFVFVILIAHDVGHLRTQSPDTIVRICMSLVGKSKQVLRALVYF